MHLRSIILLPTLVMLLIPGSVHSQTVVNPDVSAIGDMRFLFRDRNAAFLARSERVSFELRELELAFAGYLNPYARADVFIGFHPDENVVEIEEAYATVLRGLPWALQFKFGKYFLDIGKINTQHPHQWAWLEIPLMHRKFLGEEGARVVGANLSTLKAMGENALTFSLNGMGSSFFDGYHNGREHQASDEAKEKLAFSGRASIFRSLTDFTSVEGGISFLHGVRDAEADLHTDITGIDLKIKWRPDMYSSIVLVLETMHSNRELPPEHISGKHSNRALGLFSSIYTQWRRRFDGGTFIDYAEEALDEGIDTRAFGFFMGFMPAEETARLSLVLRRETSDLFSGSSISVTLQAVWSLGPHKPHPF